MTRQWTKAQKAKASKSHTGLKHDKATRKKMAESAKALWAKRRAEGFKHSEEARKHMAEATRKRCAAPDYVHNRTGSKTSPHAKQLLSEFMKKRNKEHGHPMLGKKHTAATRAKMSESQQKRIAEKGVADHVRGAAKAARHNPTASEALLRKEFQRYHVHFHFQYVIEDRYIVDFFLPDYQAVIECDGVEHQRPKGKRQDAPRDRFLRRRGFWVLRITNEDIQFDPYIAMTALLRRIK